MALDLSNIDPNARRLFAALQSQWGSDLQLTSAYRSPGHNARVGGAKNSRHMRGDAFDIDTSGMPVIFEGAVWTSYQLIREWVSIRVRQTIYAIEGPGQIRH